ncbi:MAG: RHS repeat-associated core domain-containing protein, partial [Armatimonadota bacterium]
MKSFTNRDAKKVEYEYNGVGDVWKMWSPNHATPFTYAYNANNQVTSVTNPNGYTITFAYDGGGRRTRMCRPGSEHQYGYDARNHLRYATTWKNGGGHIYRSYYYPHSWDQTLWDHTGNPLLKNEYFPDSQYAYNTHLRYDALYRLIRERVCDPYGQVVFDVTYTYDQVGNRLSETRDGVTTTYTYDDNDRLTSMTRGGQSATFGYDGEGNLLSVSGSLFGSWTLSQSDENRLQWVTYPSGGGSETDLYWTSALGQVYRSRLQGSYYRYIYDGNRVLEQTDDSGGTVARYTPESGSYYAPLLHRRRSDGTSRWPSYDGVGTIRALSDDTGTRTDAYDLDAFGRDLGGTGTTPNPYRFGGAWGYVTEPSGLLHLGQRFYWPEIGRFIEKDPSRDGMNWYAYAANNPVVFIDPEGLWSATVGGYIGIGGEVTFGVNPDGGWFWGVQDISTLPQSQRGGVRSRVC